MTPHELQIFIWTCIFLLLGFLPVLGLILLVSDIKVEKWFLKIIKYVLLIMGITYFILGLINKSIFPDNEQIILYSITISLFLHFLEIKNPSKATEVLGIVFIVTHLFSQYWEIPLFIMAHLGSSAFGYHGSIDQLYLLLVFYLALRFTDKTIDKRAIVILTIPLLSTTLAFISKPVAMQYVTPLWFLVRCLSCFCLGKFFLERRVL